MGIKFSKTKEDMIKEAELEDAKLRSFVEKQLDLKDNNEGVLRSLYKKIPTNIRLLIENIVGVDTPITAEDFTKEELVEMAFLAEKTKRRNIKKEERAKRVLASYQKDLKKGPPESYIQSDMDDFEEMIESYEKTRGKTSVNPYIRNYKSVVDASYLDAFLKTFSDDPNYRVATSLGKYNVFDKNGKSIKVRDTYNFNKKERNLPTSFRGALMQMMASPELAGEYLANFLKTEDRDVIVDIPRKSDTLVTQKLKDQTSKMFEGGSVNKQTDDLLSQDSEKDRITKALLKEREGFKLRPTEEIIDKAKATGTGLLTGTLAIPSDLVTLSSAVASGVAKYSDNPTAMMLKDVLQKAEKEVGREAFDKWFTETTGIESNPDNVDQLIGEILSPTGAFLAPVKTLKKVFAPLKKGVTDFFDKMPPPDGGVALETAGATKPLDQLEQTKKLLDKEKAVTTEAPNIIPPDEFMNVPKTTKMSMAGEKSPTGKQQIAKYKELDKTKKYNPDELFEMTGVYKGADGKFRWEIDTTEAELTGLDKLIKAQDQDVVSLGDILKYDNAFTEYSKQFQTSSKTVHSPGPYGTVITTKTFKPLKDIQVFVNKGDTGSLGGYTHSSDVISLDIDNLFEKAKEVYLALRNEPRFDKLSVRDVFKYQIESVLLHEIQHAIQAREGFVRGSNSDFFLPKGYDQDVKTNNQLLDNSYFNFYNEFKSTVITNSREGAAVDGVYNYLKNVFETDINRNSDFVQKQVLEVAKRDLRWTGFSSEKLDKIILTNIEKLKRHFNNKKILEEAQDEAIKKYRDVYGEKEAKLVQERFKERRDLASLMSIETGQVTKSDIEKIQQEMRQKPPPPEMMGKTRAERERLDKLSRTDPKTGKVKRKVSVGRRYYHSDLNTEEMISGYIIAPKLITPDGKAAPSTKTAVSREELAYTILYDKDFQKASNKALDDKGYGDTIPIFRIISNKQEAMNLENEELISGLLDKNKIFKLHEFFRQGPKRDFLDYDTKSYLLKYNVPRSKVIGYLPAYRDKINRNINKKIKEKGFGQKKISGLDTVTNPSEFTKNKMDTQDEIIASVSDIKPEVFSPEGFTEQGKFYDLNRDDSYLVNYIIQGQINNPQEFSKIKPGYSFAKDITKMENFIPASADPKTQSYIDSVKKFFDIKKMAKGGDMKKQMDLFQEGGLKDEGGTVDPVSGNDVPPGSTQEEVRDDIPAQLSEGEFVFPADVVRFLGLNFLMELRQKAKAGLKRMEEMGQMGNSDEATLPDDIPFTIDDLDMEDDLEYNKGGVVEAQTGTFVAPGSGITTTPSQFAGQQLPSAGSIPNYVAPNIPPPTAAPVGGFTPQFTAQTGQKGQQGTTPTFQTLIGDKPGQYDELREYVNEAGAKLQIPFKNGEPIYPIPEGYTFVDPEKTETEEVTTKEVTPQTTKVVEQDSGSDDQQRQDEEDKKNFGVTNPTVISLGGELDEKGSVKNSMEFSYNVKSASGLSMPVSLAKSVASIVTGKSMVADTDIITLTPKGYPTAKVELTGKQFKDIVNVDTDDGKGKKISITNKKVQDFINTKVQEAIDVAEQGKFQDQRSAAVTGSDEDTARQESYEQELSDSGADYSGYDTGDGGVPDAYDDPMMKQGGLAKRKPKVKKMKRGGLASR